MREGVSVTAGRALLRLVRNPFLVLESHSGRCWRTRANPLSVSAFHVAAVAILLSISACADKPIPPVNSYCVVKPTEAIDMRDPGLQSLWPANQGAVLTGDDNFRQLCQRTNSPGGPR